MENQQLIEEGLNYAIRNLQAEPSHLTLDKKFLKDHFELKGKNVLDFGCGMGGMTLWVAKEFDCSVDGLDIDENHIFIAKKLQDQFPDKNVYFSTKNIIEEPIDKQYDLILLNDVIEHIKVECIPAILDTLINNNLKKGGSIFFSYPPWEGPHASHMQRIIRIPWLQYFPENWVIKQIRKKNKQTVGRFDLVQEYLELNRMTHQRLSAFLKPFQLEQSCRKSHSRLNKIRFLRNRNFPFFKFLVTKELIVFRKINCVYYFFCSFAYRAFNPAITSNVMSSVESL